MDDDRMTGDDVTNDKDEGEAEGDDADDEGDQEDGVRDVEDVRDSDDPEMGSKSSKNGFWV